MAKYYMNTNAQSNGDHEVHKEGCSWMPLSHNRKYLGQFYSCSEAVIEAKKYDSNADGCKFCCPSCHTR